VKAHSLAELFPPLKGEAFDELVADIKANGLLNPIVQNDGFILDGRNRLRACELANIKPRFVQFASLKLNCAPEAYIWSQNIARRHLSDDQRAAISCQWRPQFEAEGRNQKSIGGKEAHRGRKKVVVNSPQPFSKQVNENKTRHKLAEMAQVSEHKIKQTEIVSTARPDLIPKIASGEMELRQAVKATRGEIPGPLFLPFTKVHADAIVCGKKTQTARRSKGRLAPGKIARVQVNHYADIEIIRIEAKRLEAFTEQDAMREGGYTLEEFKRVWRGIYGKWNPNQEVYAIQFVLKKVVGDVR